MKDFLNKKCGFTIIEVLIAIVISSFVILWLTTLMIKMNQEITTIQSQTSVLSDFSRFQNDFNNYKLKYPKSINAVDNSTWYDVLLLTNSWTQRWVLVWVVDATPDSPNYLKLDPLSSNAIYWEKVLVIKELSSTQTKNILSNPSSAYNIAFFDTNVYKDIKVDSLVLNSYNSWAILDFSMDILTQFSPAFIGKDKVSVISSDDRYRVNFSLVKDSWIILESSFTAPPPSWSMAWWWDCIAVDNTIGSNWSTSTCFDRRPYVHSDTWVTSTWTYNILKIPSNYNTWWTWRFNQNLTYPLTNTGKYRWSWVWSASDDWLYSCPWINTITTTNCAAANSKWYLYQWTAAMSWWVSNNSTGSRTQWICPPGWALPTKDDLLSASSWFWPYDTSGRQWNTSGRTRYYVWDRVNTPTWYFETTWVHEYIWTSYSYDSINARFHMFYAWLSPTTVQAFNWKWFWISVRCIKN